MPHLLRFSVTPRATTSLWFVVTEHRDQTISTVIDLLAHGCHPNAEFQRACDNAMRLNGRKLPIPENRRYWHPLRRWLRERPKQHYSNACASDLYVEAAPLTLTIEDHATGSLEDMHHRLGAIIWLCPRKFHPKVPVITNALTTDDMHGAVSFDEIVTTYPQWRENHPTTAAATLATQQMIAEQETTWQSLCDSLQPLTCLIDPERQSFRNPYDTEEMHRAMRRMQEETGWSLVA
jgi:hypothetical protein